MRRWCKRLRCSQISCRGHLFEWFRSFNRSSFHQQNIRYTLCRHATNWRKGSYDYVFANFQVYWALQCDYARNNNDPVLNWRQYNWQPVSLHRSAGLDPSFSDARLDRLFPQAHLRQTNIDTFLLPSASLSLRHLFDPDDFSSFFLYQHIKSAVLRTPRSGSDQLE